MVLSKKISSGDMYKIHNGIIRFWIVNLIVQRLGNYSSICDSRRLSPVVNVFQLEHKYRT